MPDWWRPKAGARFDIFQDYKKIGSCSCVVVNDQVVPRGTDQSFPSSWYVNKYTDQVRPILEIIRLETTLADARSCLQALYEISQHRGCDGRMQIAPSSETRIFLERCGFKEDNPNRKGLQYFDPKLKSISLLMGNNDQSVNFKLIPALQSAQTQIAKRVQDQVR